MKIEDKKAFDQSASKLSKAHAVLELAAKDPAFLEEEQAAFNDSLDSDPTEISDLQKLTNQAEEAE